MRESELYSIWAYQKLNHDLYTTSGQAIRVFYPGNLNSDRGADFKDAFLRIGEKEYHGDIEIHIRKRDWLAHKHQQDKEYNKVILHIIWENDKSIVTNSSQESIPTLLLSDYCLASDDIQKNIAYDCQFFSGLHKIQLNYLLYELGKKRFQHKAFQIAELNYLKSVEEIIYKLIASSLGSPNNKAGMLLLNDSINKRELQEIDKNKLSNFITQRLTQLGLTSENESTKIWQRFRIRPASQPQKRVEDFIRLRWSYRNSNLALLVWDSFIASFSLKDFQVKVSDILNSPNDNVCFGKNIVNVIIFNSFLPVIFYITKSQANKKNLAKIEYFIKEFPKLGNNRIIKAFMNKISDYQKMNFIQKEIHFQGLYYLMNNYCLKHDCQRCHKEREKLLK